MWWFFLAASFFYGLCFGSFATAMAYRIPRKIGVTFDPKETQKKTQKMARSQCPQCGHVLGAKDLVPFFSWAFSGGKCRYCACKIPFSYPLIEIVTACLCVAFFLRFGVVWETIAFMFMAPILITMVVIDLQFKILPDVLNLALFLLVPIIWLTYFMTGAASETQIVDLMQTGIIAAFVFGGMSYILRAICSYVLKKEAMGLGDVKLFFAVGAYLGIMSMPLFMVASGLSGIALGAIWKKVTGEAAFPFGPSLIFGFLICLLFGQNVLILL